MGRNRLGNCLEGKEQRLEVIKARKMPRGGNQENLNLDKGRQMDSGINVSEQYFLHMCVKQRAVVH